MHSPLIQSSFFEIPQSNTIKTSNRNLTPKCNCANFPTFICNWENDSKGFPGRLDPVKPDHKRMIATVLEGLRV